MKSKLRIRLRKYQCSLQDGRKYSKALVQRSTSSFCAKISIEAANFVDHKDVLLHNRYHAKDYGCIRAFNFVL